MKSKLHRTGELITTTVSDEDEDSRSTKVVKKKPPSLVAMLPNLRKTGGGLLHRIDLSSSSSANQTKLQTLLEQLDLYPIEQQPKTPNKQQQASKSHSASALFVDTQESSQLLQTLANDRQFDTSQSLVDQIIYSKSPLSDEYQNVKDYKKKTN